jgi:AcrR family transcriptional regulator
MVKSQRKERVFRQREQEILDAAAELFDQMDWRTVTADRIAEHAGIGKGTIYLHFRNKDELVARLILRHVKRMLGLLAAPPSTASASGRWTLLVEVARRLAGERPEEARHMPLLFDAAFPQALSASLLDELAAARSALLAAIATRAEGGAAPRPESSAAEEARALFAWGAISACLYGVPLQFSAAPNDPSQMPRLLAEFLVSSGTAPFTSQ